MTKRSFFHSYTEKRIRFFATKEYKEANRGRPWLFSFVFFAFFCGNSSLPFLRRFLIFAVFFHSDLFRVSDFGFPPPPCCFVAKFPCNQAVVPVFAWKMNHACCFQRLLR